MLCKDLKGGNLLLSDAISCTKEEGLAGIQIIGDWIKPAFWDESIRFFEVPRIMRNGPWVDGNCCLQIVSKFKDALR
jgi:hypothetical protein